MILTRFFTKYSISHLNPLQVQVTQLKGTEPPFSSPLLHEKATGFYSCFVCKEVLFESDSKFDSGSGWPSFFQPVSRYVVKFSLDYSHNMTRNEVSCYNCGSHLGHFFEDGPKGSRYCINGCSLSFIHGNYVYK
jgi:peptide-methionine (R)-S-oxide reductase